MQYIGKFNLYSMKSRTNGYNLKRHYTQNLQRTEQNSNALPNDELNRMEQQIYTCKRIDISASNKSRFGKNGELLLPIHRIYLVIVCAHHLFEKRDEVFRVACAIHNL